MFYKGSMRVGHKVLCLQIDHLGDPWTWQLLVMSIQLLTSAVFSGIFIKTHNGYAGVSLPHPAALQQVPEHMLMEMACNPARREEALRAAAHIREHDLSSTVMVSTCISKPQNVCGAASLVIHWCLMRVRCPRSTGENVRCSYPSDISCRRSASSGACAPTSEGKSTG